MSHHEAPIICPNCGYPAVKNYCAQCGQATHLHDETFLGLISHFVGHYFHYDSKFWHTLKTLWFSPGKLTTAYWNKQRARYIPPISLYIFISVAFFLTSSIMMSGSPVDIHVNNIAQVHDTVKSVQHKDVHLSRGKAIFHSLRQSIDRAHDAETSGSEEWDKGQEKMFHMMPKVFFFMIPLMAFVLTILFARRKELSFVNHAIFALNYHSLWFSVMILAVLYPFDAGNDLVGQLLTLVTGVYFVLALKNVYNIGWIKALLYSIITALTYMIFIVLSLVALVALTF